MSLWDKLSKTYKSGGFEKVADVANQNGGLKEVLKSTNNEYRKIMEERSALKPGRMRESNCVKGDDCSISSKPGIYHHVNRDTGISDYDGETSNLRKRQQEHVRSGKLNTESHYVRYGEAREDSNFAERRRTEQEHIQRHNPSGNTYKGGNGRRAKSDYDEE